jgi:hypothetical protein
MVLEKVMQKEHRLQATHLTNKIPKKIIELQESELNDEDQGKTRTLNSTSPTRDHTTLSKPITDSPSRRSHLLSNKSPLASLAAKQNDETLGPLSDQKPNSLLSYHFRL